LLALLVSAQKDNGDLEGALATTRAAMAASPNDKLLQSDVVDLLKQMHRNAEAVEAAHQVLDETDDPNVINNTVYVLAEMKAELPFAEAQSQRSIDLFAKTTGRGTVQEANTEAFRLSAQMVAAWDTLGYIFLIQKKAAEAERYLYAAWFQSPDVVQGDHLALAYEAQGKKAEALRIFRLALQTEFAKNSKEEFAEATAHAEQLEKAGVKAPDDSAQLLAMRTFHIPKAAGAQGGGTVRLQIDSHGVADAVLVTGAEPLKAELESVKKLAMPGAVPAGSQARVLRDAIVYCGKTTAECDFVLMPRSGIVAESASE
jgi:tetratricopeptide (TPR) repeat protein